VTTGIAGIERFQSLSPAEFFYRNKEIAGFSNPARALYQTVRELVENALDATDTYGILPIIKVSIDADTSGGRSDVYVVSVEDNGIGIPPHQVPQAFAQLLYSSKYVLRQTRGMFGLGAKMAVLYGQVTTGRPVEVISSPTGSTRIYSFKLMIDIKNNRPIILYKASYRKSNDWHGTVVKVAIEGDWGRSKPKIYEYLKRTAIIAPYATIVFKDPDGNIIYFKRSTTLMPKPPKEVKPHPHGIDIEMLKMMISVTTCNTLKEFLIKEFQSIGEVTSKAIIESAGLSPDVNPKLLTVNEVENLVRVLKEFKDIRPPKADHLSYLGEEIIKSGLESILKPEFVTAKTRKPSVYEGHAFIVEVGLAYGGKIPLSEEPILLRFANKIPLLYDEKSDVAWKVLSQNIDWSHYEISFPAPLVTLVHICSTKIPYKGVGKESIADVPEIEREIENGIREVARELRSYIIKKRREMEEAEKAIGIIKYIPDIASALHKIVGGNVSEDVIKGKLLELVLKKYRSIRIERVEDVVIGIE